jgi:dihydropyrimidinase
VAPRAIALRRPDIHHPSRDLRFCSQPGTITVGADADLAIWDPDAKRRIRHADLHDGADSTPYEGMDVTGWPTTVILGGRVMIRDGALVGRKGDGAYRPAGTRRPAGSPASMEKQGQ